MRRFFILILAICASGGCAPHAARVRCDRHLTPINAAPAGGPPRHLRP